MLRSLALATTFLFASLGFARAQQVEPDKFPPMVCAYNASLPSIAAGSFGLLQCDAQGRIIISNPGGGGGGGNAATTSNGTDAQATSATNQQNVTYNYLFNGTSWDRMRGTGGSANVNVQNFPATQPVTGTFFQSIQPVSEASGANVTLGSTTDAANAATLMGQIKQTNVLLGAPTPAGTALIGGTNLYINSALNASGNPAFVQLTAGTAKVGIFTTDQTTHGTTDKVAADFYVAGAANSTTNRAFTNSNDTLQAGTALIGQTYTASAQIGTLTPLAASGSYTSAIYNSGVYPSGTQTPYAYFTASVYADQAGTFYVSSSIDNTAFYPRNGTNGQAYTAGTNVDLKLPVDMQIWQIKFVNGTTAQTKFFASGMFSAN